MNANIEVPTELGVALERSSRLRTSNPLRCMAAGTRDTFEFTVLRTIV